MMFFRALAFTQIDGSPSAIGNPANVVLFNNAEDMNGELMSQISTSKLPITVFLKRRGDSNEFDLRYYTLDGKEFGLCGHGTICASGILKTFCDPQLDDIIFHLSDGRAINSKVTKNSATIGFSSALVSDLEDGLIRKKICAIFKINENDVRNFYKSELLRDYLIYLKDGTLVRNLKPDVNLLEKFAKEFDSRGVMTLGNSDMSDIDVEVRVFSHLLVGKREGDGEDIACGSSNCSVASILNKESYKVVFPYQYAATGNFGGFQNVTYDKEKKTINLTGGYKTEENDNFLSISRRQSNEYKFL